MHRTWIRAALPLLLAAQVAATAEQSLPDVHAPDHHELVSAGVGERVVTDSPADLDHGHSHACHCVHQHAPGIPVAQAAAPFAPCGEPQQYTLRVRSATRSLAPPFHPPRF